MRSGVRMPSAIRIGARGHTETRRTVRKRCATRSAARRPSAVRSGVRGRAMTRSDVRGVL